jgi:hypothetical protein
LEGLVRLKGGKLHREPERAKLLVRRMEALMDGSTNAFVADMTVLAILQQACMDRNNLKDAFGRCLEMVDLFKEASKRKLGHGALSKLSNQLASSCVKLAIDHRLKDEEMRRRVNFMVLQYHGHVKVSKMIPPLVTVDALQLRGDGQSTYFESVSSALSPSLYQKSIDLICSDVDVTLDQRVELVSNLISDEVGSHKSATTL